MKCIGRIGHNSAVEAIRGCGSESARVSGSDREIKDFFRAEITRPGQLNHRRRSRWLQVTVQSRIGLSFRGLVLSSEYAIASIFVRQGRGRVGRASSGGAQAREFAIGQLIDGAVANVEIVDILQAVGMTSPDISVLSPEFLEEVQRLEQKNLTLEALKRLLNGEIKSRAQSNVTEARQFSERLEAALARYHAGALDSLQVLQAMVDMAKDLSAAAARGEQDGLSPEERAFYDALAAHDTAVEAMGVDALKLIAVEVLEALQSNATVDWNRRENARARMRTLVKRILKRRGYPPDLSDAAVQNVLAQAEAFLSSQSR